MKRERRPGAPLSAAVLGVIVLALLTAALAAHEARVEVALREAWFDVCQRLFPRLRTEDPVVVVEIDERSLAQLGQWPWPRSRLAALVDSIAEAGPAVIGIDVLFVERDRYAPHMLSLQLGLAPEDTARLVAAIPDSDAVFARALAAAPVVLGVAGIGEALPPPGAQVEVAPVLQRGGEALKHVRRYPGLLRSFYPLDAAAKGHGALNAEPERGILRTIPTLIGTDDGHLVPGLAVAILHHLGAGEPLQVEIDAHGIHTVKAAGLRVPTRNDGGWWLHFSHWEDRPAYSAADVLHGRIDMSNLAGRIVLIGYTALGLQDTVTTPLGRMPGVEAHAEALENALGGRLLQRPPSLRLVETALLLALGLHAILSVASWRPLYVVLGFAALVIAIVGGGIGAFTLRGWLIDIANPIAAATAVLMVTLGATLGETQTQRRQLRRELAQTREAQARLQGELDAARRIQLGMLPDASAAQDPRYAIAARMLPARDVGGDLYDFFMVGANRLFFLVGDVSGKGLPSALFMALTKAQVRGAALRADGDPGVALTEANLALTQDNPELLFLTMFAAELDLQSGALRWSNAGHDSPSLVVEGKVTGAFPACGPPLCALDGYPYPTEAAVLPLGAFLCLVSDGVSEAQDREGRLFGGARVDEALLAVPQAAGADGVVSHLVASVESFAAGTEQADDITVLCLERRGPV